MVKPIVMPKYGLQQDQGTVIRWLKGEGERVKRGEALLELETDKAVFEYESPEAGFVRKTPAASEATPATPAAAPAVGGEDRIRSSPAAKKLAKDLGVDLATVKGTGPGGRITREDVEQAATARQAVSAAAAPTPAAGRRPLSRMRQAIGRAMSESKRNIPHFYVSAEVDMTDAEAWRRRVASERGVKLSVTDVLVKAAAMTLAKYPALNASLDGDATVAHGGVHVGLAVGMEDGLLVPVIADAHAKSMVVLARERAEAVEAARGGRLRGTAQATFTISNLGMFGVTSFIAIVNPPESAALAVGAILPQVRPFGEPLTIAVRQVMQVTLSADHRLTDGMLAAQYLQDLKRNLEGVETLEGWL